MILQQNTILITGGSSGVGLELAKRLVEKDNRVIICGRSQEKLANAKAKHPDIESFRCDLSKLHDCEKLAKWIRENHPDCNILINNAAIVHTTSFYKDEKALEKVDAEIRTNLFAPVALTKLLIPTLEKNPNPKLVNITSALAYVPKSDYLFYSATKSALHSFTQTLRIQMKELPIDIAEVFLPSVNTPFHKGKPPKGAISAQDAVDKIIRGLENGKTEIRVKTAKLIYFMHRIAPGFILRKVNSQSTTDPK